MIMSHPAASSGPIGRELGLCMALGLLLLVWGVLQQVSAFESLSPDWSALARSVDLNLSGPFGRQVWRFGLTLLLLHLMLGAVCWVLGALTHRAFARPSWTRLRYSLLWLAAVVAFLLVANATLYPWSESGFASEVVRRPLLAGLRLHDLLALGLFAGTGTVLVKHLRQSPRWRRLVPRIVMYGAMALLLVVAVRALSSKAVAAAPAHTPNIILVGVDSLRPDVVGASERAFGVTPNIDLFLREGAHQFSDTITPLARTFPAWTSILSGRYPRHTGARENLVRLPVSRSSTALPGCCARAAIAPCSPPTKFGSRTSMKASASTRSSHRPWAPRISCWARPTISR